MGAKLNSGPSEMASLLARGLSSGLVWFQGCSLLSIFLSLLCQGGVPYLGTRFGQFSDMRIGPVEFDRVEDHLLDVSTNLIE